MDMAAVAAGPPADQVIIDDPQAVDYCDREIVLKTGEEWQCACGASGPAGRSDDGIPFLTEDILLHRPGEKKPPADPRVLRHEHIRRTA